MKTRKLVVLGVLVLGCITAAQATGVLTNIINDANETWVIGSTDGTVTSSWSTCIGSELPVNVYDKDGGDLTFVVEDTGSSCTHSGKDGNFFEVKDGSGSKLSSECITNKSDSGHYTMSMTINNPWTATLYNGDDC